MEFTRDESKNTKLKADATRKHVGFEEIVYAIEHGWLVERTVHRNTDRHPEQPIFLVNINNYIYEVPARETNHGYHFITCYPSKHYTKLYLS